MLYQLRVFDLLRLGLFDLPARCCAVIAPAYCCLPPLPPPLYPFSIAVAALHLFLFLLLLPSIPKTAWLNFASPFHDLDIFRTDYQPVSPTPSSSDDNVIVDLRKDDGKWGGGSHLIPTPSKVSMCGCAEYINPCRASARLFHTVSACCRHSLWTARLDVSQGKSEEQQHQPTTASMRTTSARCSFVVFHLKWGSTKNRTAAAAACRM